MPFKVSAYAIWIDFLAVKYARLSYCVVVTVGFISAAYMTVYHSVLESSRPFYRSEKAIILFQF